MQRVRKVEQLELDSNPLSVVPRLATVTSIPTRCPVRRRPVLTGEVAASLAAQRSLIAGYRRVGVTGQTFSIYLLLMLSYVIL